jgi:protease I
MAHKTVILLVAQEGYQPMEYGVTQEILASAGVGVITASNKPGVALATDSSTTMVEMTLEQINPTLYDGLFLIGGQRALEFLDNSVVYTLLQEMKALNKLYGAICISPRILAHAQVLGGKKATGWNKDHQLETIFKKYAAIYVPQEIVVDGNVITASGPEASQAFAQAILKALGLLH